MVPAGIGVRGTCFLPGWTGGGGVGVAKCKKKVDDMEKFCIFAVTEQI